MRNNFEQAFVSVADKHAPVIQKRVLGVNKCQWMNNAIKRDMQQRDYRHYRNRVTIGIRRSKETYNRRVIAENSHDDKTFWRT